MTRDALIPLLTICLCLPLMGDQKKEKEKFKEVKALAEKGDPQQQFFLGGMYAKGNGCLEDDDEAIRWYKKSAEQGYAEAQYNLGVLHYHGRGGLQDHEEAAKWWKLAAEQKLEIAQWNLEMTVSYTHLTLPTNREV